MGKIQQMAKNLGGVLSKNSPHILTGLGCAGLISTSILTSKATIKAIYILDQDKAYRVKNHEPEKQSGQEIIKLTWKVFIPAGVVGATSIACIIGANTVNTKRNAALAALYSLSETAFRDYKSKVVEEIGKAKETKIKDAVAHDTIAQNPLGDRTIIVTGNGKVKCYDKLCDRYFESSYEFIRQRVNDLNYRLRTEMWLDLNEFYYAIGLPDSKLGRQVGFDIDRGQIEVEYSTQLDEQGVPCLVIDAKVYPNPDYI